MPNDAGAGLKLPFVSRRRYDALVAERDMLGGELQVRWAEILRLKQKEHHHGHNNCPRCGRWMEKAPKKHVCRESKWATTTTTTSTTTASPGKGFVVAPPIPPGTYNPTFHSRVSFPKKKGR